MKRTWQIIKRAFMSRPVITGNYLEKRARMAQITGKSEKPGVQTNECLSYGRGKRTEN